MNSQKLYRNVKDAITILPERYQRIVLLRFGIDGGEPLTLEVIGRKYRITRERVRQIIAKAFSDLLSSKAKSILTPTSGWVYERMSEEGCVVPEEWFLEFYGKDRKGALLFILHIDQEFLYKSGNGSFYHRWYSDEQVHNKAMQELLSLERYLDKKKMLISFDKVISFLSHPNFMRISKKILQSSLGGYGLSHWPQVLPKSIKNKAYVVLLKETKPLHFMEIANRINEFGLGKKKALRQTVHNELIKDSRFVLVGRGLYALREWGFREGTVRDIIYSLLKEKGQPLDRKELIDLVLKERFVQPNTILLNLNEHNGIAKLPDGRYALK